MDKPFTNILLPIVIQFIIVGICILYVQAHFFGLSDDQLRVEMAFNTMIIPLVSIFLARFKEQRHTGWLIFGSLFLTLSINIVANLLLLLI